MKEKTLNLNDEIKEQDAYLREKVLCDEIINLFDKHLTELKETRPDKNSLREGEQAPDFMLVNTRGAIIRLYKLLREGMTVISFYRGSWCPFCNIELKHLQKEWGEISKLGVNLVAVSPQLPEHSLQIQHDNEIGYECLSDVGNRIAEKFGITYEIPDELVEAYKKELNIDLDEYNGLGYKNKLPLPATFILDTDGTILKVFVSWDYSQRLEPSEILDFLKSKLAN